MLKRIFASSFVPALAASLLATAATTAGCAYHAPQKPDPVSSPDQAACPSGAIASLDVDDWHLLHGDDWQMPNGGLALDDDRVVLAFGASDGSARVVGGTRDGATWTDVPLPKNPGGDSLHAIYSDADGLYLVMGDTALTLELVPRAGGPAVPLETSAEFLGVVSTPTTIYASTGSSILAIPKDGGRPSTLYTSDVVMNLATDGASLYWSEGGGFTSNAPTIKTASLSGAFTPITIATSDAWFVMGVAGEGGTVVFTTSTRGSIQVVTARAGEAPKVVDEAEGVNYASVAPVVSSNGAAYYVLGLDVKRAPFDGSTAPVTVAESSVVIDAMRVDRSENVVYVAGSCVFATK